jgi:hypothetical protein
MAKKSRTKKPGNKPFTAIAIVVFGLVALVHLLRLLLDWYVVVAGVSIPMWVSVLGLIVTAGLATMLWREQRK